jgi:hypothetical protein
MCQQAALVLGLRAGKDVLTNMTDEIAGEIFSINELNQECRRLQGQIVKSPARLKREIASMGTKLHQEKALVVEVRGLF